MPGKKLCILLVLSTPALIAAQHGSTTARNPASGPADREAGARIFRIQCAGCHGLDGSGGAGGSNLATGAFRHGSSDEALFRNIAKGIPGTAMPAFTLDGRQIWQLVTFVRSLGVGRGAKYVKGDPATGQRLFETSGCIRCHSISGTGGLLGPDLAGIAGRHSLAALEQSVLDPNAEVAPEYWSVRARTKDGRPVSGILLNEDTYSYQVRSDTGRLQSLLKQELTDHRIVRTSPMPSYKNKLQRSELEDLIAYLVTLREDKHP